MGCLTGLVKLAIMVLTGGDVDFSDSDTGSGSAGDGLLFGMAMDGGTNVDTGERLTWSTAGTAGGAYYDPHGNVVPAGKVRA